MEDDVVKWGRLGGPYTLGLTRGRGVASFLAQRRSASAGLYYLELFRATSNYSLFFAMRIARAVESTTGCASNDLQAWLRLRRAVSGAIRDLRRRSSTLSAWWM